MERLLEKLSSLKAIVSSETDVENIRRELSQSLTEIENGLIVLRSQESEQEKQYTEQIKKHESQFSLITDNLIDIIWTIDKYGKFTYVSPSATKWLGFLNSEVLNQDVTKILHPNIQEQYKKQINQRLEDENKGIKVPNLEYIVPVISKTGEVFYAEIKGSSLRDENDNYVGMVGITRDVTLRIIAENKLKESERQLTESLASRDKFLSIIAHDLKSPFSAVVGLIDVLYEMHEKMNAESRAEMIKAIKNSTSRTYKLLENLLAWSAIHTERKKVEQSTFNFEEILNFNLELFRDIITKKQITILLNGNFKTLVYADKDMIDSVLRNLLSNALKYTLNNGKISVAIDNSEKHAVKITVSDSGIGINSQDIDKLFKIGTNYSTPGLENEKGTGFGLILCSEFIEKNGGKIWATSKQGKGSEFAFTLPLSKQV